ncbi:unnamed protein product [Lathyrus oleraceus]|uniref:uncharacterized protein LOC127136189 n=1 Tax=Pisum sativum TaxID=3888 RepID=UPI001FC49888|nr:uncharacterized protein LOC127136189 [Pisum sativum]
MTTILNPLGSSLKEVQLFNRNLGSDVEPFCMFHNLVANLEHNLNEASPSNDNLILKSLNLSLDLLTKSFSILFTITGTFKWDGSNMECGKMGPFARNILL